MDQRQRRLDANLSALGEDQPELARRIEQLEIPAWIEPATGRDGSDTFRIHHDDGTWHWFGRSSMPSVSAPALMAGFRSDGHNVILPTVATGRELLIAAERSPRHSAVFVFEADPLAIKLALCLYDLSELIRMRRVVLLCGDDVASALVEFLAAKPGFEFPQRMVSLPILPPNEQERCRLLIESAGPRVGQAQWAEATRIAKEITTGPASGVSSQPRIVLLSRDPRDELLELAGQLGSTLERMGWPLACCLPDRPDRCHSVARLESIQQHRPDVVLLLNCLKGPLGRLLPEDLPVCSWLLTPDSIEAALADGVKGNKAIFASQPAMIERLGKAGAPPESLRLLEQAVDPTVFRPLEDSVKTDSSAGYDVAVLADGADLRPAAANITLASHVRLWEQVRVVAAGSIDQGRDDLASRVLDRAGKECGVHLSDADVRSRFIEVIRRRLVPTLAVHTTVERLAEAGLRVALGGRHWETHNRVKHLVRGPIPDAAGRRLIYNGSRVVACPVFDDATVRMVLECLAAGGCPVYRSPEAPPSQLHPQLQDVLTAVPSASSLNVLVRRSGELAADAAARESSMRAGRTLVLEKHTFEHRLRAMHACLNKV
jgi:hypothetical protein